MFGRDSFIEICFHMNCLAIPITMTINVSAATVYNNMFSSCSLVGSFIISILVQLKIKKTMHGA